MTPAEKIQAAIDKRETLKAESIGGEWRVSDEGWTSVPIEALFRSDSRAELLKDTVSGVNAGPLALASAILGEDS